MQTNNSLNRTFWWSYYELYDIFSYVNIFTWDTVNSTIIASFCLRRNFLLVKEFDGTMIQLIKSTFIDLSRQVYNEFKSDETEIVLVINYEPKMMTIKEVVLNIT